MSNAIIIHTQEYCSTYIAKGKMGRCSCTAGHQQAADRYAKKWYGSKFSATRAPEHDTHSKGNHGGTETSVLKTAWIVSRN